MQEQVSSLSSNQTCPPPLPQIRPPQSITSAVWDKIADEYAKRRYFGKRLRKEERIILNEICKDINSVIDIGCGCGRHVRFFRSLGKFVIGIDISVKMLYHARKKSNDKFILASLHDLPFKDNSFDLVTCLGNTIGSLEELQRMNENKIEIGKYRIYKAIKEMIRVAKRKIIIEFRCKEKTFLEKRKIFEQSYYVYVFSINDIKNIFEKIKQEEKKVLNYKIIEGRKISDGKFVYVIIELRN
jgi:ubiquinone/menaquinone biosynthesis C-methylase UbiE